MCGQCTVITCRVLGAGAGWRRMLMRLHSLAERGAAAHCRAASFKTRIKHRTRSESKKSNGTGHNQPAIHRYRRAAHTRTYEYIKFIAAPTAGRGRRPPIHQMDMRPCALLSCVPAPRTPHHPAPLLHHPAIYTYTHAAMLNFYTFHI